MATVLQPGKGDDYFLRMLGWQDAIYDEALAVTCGRLIVNAKLQDWSKTYSGPRPGATGARKRVMP